jgi:hypothetical protein
MPAKQPVLTVYPKYQSQVANMLLQKYKNRLVRLAGREVEEGGSIGSICPSLLVGKIFGMLAGAGAGANAEARAGEVEEVGGPFVSFLLADTSCWQTPLVGRHQV